MALNYSWWTLYPWPPESNPDLNSYAYIHNLQLQWNPMGSNGKPVSAQRMSFQISSNVNQRMNQLSHAYILNLQLQWTPMGSNGKPVSAQLVSF